ncbi:MAG TPA: hypothetical protein VF393_02900 [archaeon]
MTKISKKMLTAKMLTGCNSSEHNHRQCKDYAKEIGKFPASLAVGYAHHAMCIGIQSLDLPLPSFACS